MIYWPSSYDSWYLRVVGYNFSCNHYLRYWPALFDKQVRQYNIRTTNSKETKSSQIRNELKTHLAYLSATTALHRPQYFMSSVLSSSIIDYCAVWRINNYYNQAMHRNRLPAETFKRRWVKLLTQRWFSAEFTAPFLRIFSAFAWEKVYCTNDANWRSCLMRCYNFQRRPTLTN